MGSILSKPKAPDTSRQQALLAEQEARVQQQEAETKRREAASQRARRARTAGGASLLTGSEQGVKNTLG
jgi:hypothetical protein